MSAASDARKSAGSTMEFDMTMNRLKEQYNDVREAEVLRQREALETKVEYNNKLQVVKKACRKVFDKYSSLNSSYGYLKISQFKEILVIANIVP